LLWCPLVMQDCRSFFCLLWNHLFFIKNKSLAKVTPRPVSRPRGALFREMEVLSLSKIVGRVSINPFGSLLKGCAQGCLVRRRMHTWNPQCHYRHVQYLQFFTITSRMLPTEPTTYPAMKQVKRKWYKW
jgi:hypothetical protein